MKKNIITILTVLALSTLAHARIGETVAECKARYGEVKLEDEDQKFYQKSGYTIAIFFNDNGKCCQIHYLKSGEGELTEKEVNAFMNANGKNWKKIKANKTYIKWESGGKFAYDTAGTLLIRTIAHDAFVFDEADRKEAEKLNAF